MDRNRIIELLNWLDLPEGEYCVVSGGALVMRGIREKASDLDLSMTKEAMAQLEKRFNITKTEGKHDNLYRLNDDIEFFVNKKEEFNLEMVDGYPLETLEIISFYKRRRNSPKDQRDLELIELYLKNQTKK